VKVGEEVVELRVMGFVDSFCEKKYLKNIWLATVRPHYKSPSL